MIARYIGKHYEWPPCWQLVADVYQCEKGLIIDDHTPSQSAMRDVSNAFRLALHDNAHGFSKSSLANDFDVVLLGKNKSISHCGIFWQGGVLHALKNMVIWQPIAQISDNYRLIEFWTYHGKN